MNEKTKAALPTMKVEWETPDRGSVRVGAWTKYEFAMFEEKLHIASHLDVDPLEIARAARAIRKERPDVEVVVRTLKPPTGIMNGEIPQDLIGRIDRLLREALRALGTTDYELGSLPMYGVGSEFRGFLGSVGRFALKFLAASILIQGQAVSDKIPLVVRRARLADAILTVTDAVAFAMRDDIRPAWELTIAVGIASLEDVMRTFETSVVWEE